MRRIVLLVAIASISSFPTQPAREKSATLVFERNDGQHPGGVRYLARGDRYQLAFLDDQLRVTLHSSDATTNIGMRFDAARSPLATSRRHDFSPPRAEVQLAGTVNYLSGSNPRLWRTDIPVYERVRYQRDGFAVVFYGRDRQLEYDLVVPAGSDPNGARIAFDGTDSVNIAADGSLMLGIGDRGLAFSKPLAYQNVNGIRRSVEVAYSTHEDGIGFEVGAYDRSQTLIIDPVLVFSTYLGGSNQDWIYDVAVDAAGATYTAGTTLSNNYPLTSGALQPTRRGTQDAVVTKLDRNGALVYATYFGGSDAEGATGIAVDPTGAAYVTGYTSSTDLPVSSNAFQRTASGGTDGYVLKLAPAGNRISYLTYLGGTGEDGGSSRIVVDAVGVATVAGSTTSADFPTTGGAWISHRSGTSQIGVATRLNAAGSGLVYSTYLSGTIAQFANAIALDATGRAVVAGFVLGPMTTTATLGSPDGSDAFVLKLNANASGVVFSTRFGGSLYENATALAVDTVNDTVVVAGQTQSADFPVSSGSPQLNGSADAYLLRLKPAGNAVEYSTLLGGSDVETAVALDVHHEDVTVFGYTQSKDFPLKSPLQTSNRGQLDAFITRVKAGVVIFSTYLGGSVADWTTSGAVDGAGGMTVAGYSYSSDYPTAHAAQPGPGQAQRTIPDGFVSRAAIRPRGTPGPNDVVVHVASAATLHGNWFREPDATAAGGAALHNPNAGAPKLTSALANPADYFEFTVDGLTRSPYMLWIRGKADGNAYTNDSVYVQFSQALDGDESHAAHEIFKIGTTQGLPVSIEECSNCGVHGWGWQDGGYGARVPGPSLYFRTGAPVTIRVQRREDGISIDQIVLASEEDGSGPNFYFAPGYQKDDDTIVTAQDNPGGGAVPGDIVLYPGVDSVTSHGAWNAVRDTTAAGGSRIYNPDAGAPKLITPLASPTDYFEMTFNAKANVAYRLWIRGRADNDYWGNDSVYVQFQTSVTGTGAPIWRIGTTSATTYSVENCSGCGLKAWGWNDNAYEGLGPVVYFAADGDQTIRIQKREDGISIDQIVLSPANYIDRAPGATKNDTTIVPR